MHTKPSRSASTIAALTLSLTFAGCASEAFEEGEPLSAGSDALVSRAADLSADGAASLDTSARSRGTATVTATTKTPLVTAPPLDVSTLPTLTSTATSELESNHPWVVDIGGTGGLSCRGVLIHPSWVLTAAHCIGPYAGTVSYTRTDPTGAVSQDSRPMAVNSAQRGMFKHPAYEFDTGFGQPKNDIALIRLASPFHIDRNIQPAGLPRFYANPGRVGTLPTHNHSGAPTGYTAIVRSAQLTAAQCPAPAGFLCINPPTGSLCEGDSGSGFIEVLDGRAQVIGIASNMSAGAGTSCIPAGGQAQLSDVYAYRDWILNTMGMNPEQVAGRVRLRWSGSLSPSIMSLQCLSADLPAIEVPMNVPGGEIAMDCDDARVFCQAQGANMSLSGFTLRTIAPNGSSSLQSLSYLSSWTAAFGDPGASFLEYTCAVSKYGLTLPTTTTGGVLAKF